MFSSLIQYFWCYGDKSGQDRLQRNRNKTTCEILPSSGTITVRTWLCFKCNYSWAIADQCEKEKKISFSGQITQQLPMQEKKRSWRARGSLLCPHPSLSRHTWWNTRVWLHWGWCTQHKTEKKQPRSYYLRANAARRQNHTEQERFAFPLPGPWKNKMMPPRLLFAFRLFFGIYRTVLIKKVRLLVNISVILSLPLLKKKKKSIQGKCMTVPCKLTKWKAETQTLLL